MTLDLSIMAVTNGRDSSWLYSKCHFRLAKSVALYITGLSKNHALTTTNCNDYKFIYKQENFFILFYDYTTKILQCLCSWHN